MLDERGRRTWAATEARALGWGGVSHVAEATGLARNTIAAGLKELEGGERPGHADVPVEPGRRRVRRPGAGRKKLTETAPRLLEALEALVNPATRGDPMSPLRWTCKSTDSLAETLSRQGHPASARTVARLLRQMDYSLQSTRKVNEGRSHPDRDRQFGYISRQTRAFQQRGQPVVSVDTKKKELIGEYHNAGREWQPRGHPERVNVHDFRDPDVPKAVPYGVYDVTANAAWVNVGTDHDTPEFAVQSIRTWWRHMGRRMYPKAHELLIMADCGGSNGYRARAWKHELQKLANDVGLRISVCHFPPGTSKWNKIEHRLFCHITQNWRGRPLVDHEVVVSLIGSTRTKAGLKVKARLDPRSYEKGVKVTDEQLADVRVRPARFHGEWNYSIAPH
jgi:hypothetical protein